MFAHTATAALSCHVQNFVVTIVLELWMKNSTKFSEMDPWKAFYLKYCITGFLWPIWTYIICIYILYIIYIIYIIYICMFIVQETIHYQAALQDYIWGYSLTIWWQRICIYIFTVPIWSMNNPLCNPVMLLVAVWSLVHVSNEILPAKWPPEISASDPIHLSCQGGNQHDIGSPMGL